MKHIVKTGENTYTVAEEDDGLFIWLWVLLLSWLDNIIEWRERK